MVLKWNKDISAPLPLRKKIPQKQTQNLRQNKEKEQ